MSPTATLLSWQPDGLTPAQLAAVSYLARYSGPTHTLYAFQLQRWFGQCDSKGLDPLMMHGVRGFFRFAHIDGLITADPADRGDLGRPQGVDPEGVGQRAVKHANLGATWRNQMSFNRYRP